MPTTCSSRILEGWRPPYDATVVERLAAAGAVIVGKTNLDEFAMGSSTENSAFGPTRNPHDPTRVPGGSLGRQRRGRGRRLRARSLWAPTPAARSASRPRCAAWSASSPPTARVSRYGLVAFASSLDQIGPFATTVADAALVLEVIAGHDPRDSTSIPQPAPSLSAIARPWASTGCGSA